ncbi:Lipid A export ATP-binding/permease protein MsbA [Moraxella cuniculi]|uniref:Lipid A export ATP-binding/permease protein MsbA n=1 Tax=Moraxella cuniculi TaxID=34061 RepID=A0A3S4SZD5_9GAMM|nr:Lipid A export ATP-binding/permease protein MsbA [Moraxella cuniculi]
MAISYLRQDMFDKMLLLPSGYYQNTPSGHVLMNIVQMAENSMSNASNVFIVLTRDTLIVIGLVFVLFYLNWQLTLIVLIMFPVLS